MHCLGLTTVPGVLMVIAGLMPSLSSSAVTSTRYSGPPWTQGVKLRVQRIQLQLGDVLLCLLQSASQLQQLSAVMHEALSGVHNLEP